jgi:hypothetical protein
MRYGSRFEDTCNGPGSQSAVISRAQPELRRCVRTAARRNRKPSTAATVGAPAVKRTAERVRVAGTAPVAGAEPARRVVASRPHRPDACGRPSMSLAVDRQVGHLRVARVVRARIAATFDGGYFSYCRADGSWIHPFRPCATRRNGRGSGPGPRRPRRRAASTWLGMGRAAHCSDGPVAFSMVMSARASRIAAVVAAGPTPASMSSSRAGIHKIRMWSC